MSGERGAASGRATLHGRLTEAAEMLRRIPEVWYGDVAAVDEAAALLVEVRAVLESVEWAGGSIHYMGASHSGCCPTCKRDTYGGGHRPDCLLSALLSRLQSEQEGA